MLARIARWLSRFSPSSMKARSTICKLTGPLSLVMASPVNTRARSMTSRGRMSKTLTLASNIVISCADFILFYLFNLYHEKPRRRTTRSWERPPNEQRRIPSCPGFPRVKTGPRVDLRRADAGLADGRGDQNDRVLQDRTRRSAERAWFRSGLANVGGLESLRSPGHLELDPISLGQALEALGLNGVEMHEHVLATLLGYEAVPLRIVEPLDGTLCHRLYLSGEADASVKPRHHGGEPCVRGGKKEGAE